MSTKTSDLTPLLDQVVNGHGLQIIMYQRCLLDRDLACNGANGLKKVRKY